MEEEEEKTAPNILFLIGNGYDLYNGLKTRYKDFIYYYIFNCVYKAERLHGHYEDNCVEIKIEKSYFNLNLEINKYQALHERVHSVKLKYFLNSEDNKHLFTIKPKSVFISTILSECDDETWGGIEDAIYRCYRTFFDSTTDFLKVIKQSRKNCSTYLEKHEEIKKLISSINDLKSHLIEYLKELLVSPPSFKPNNIISDTNKFVWFSRNRYKNAYVLNFNYTNYIDDFFSKVLGQYDNSIQELITINIHGTLESAQEDIIFGIGDEHEEFIKTIESYYDDEWLEPLKSFFYLHNNNYQNLLLYLQDEYEVCVIGHSCSITDRTLLKMIFQNENCQKVHIFHYKGKESYLRTAYNISRNMDDKIRFRQIIQPFDKKLSFD